MIHLDWNAIPSCINPQGIPTLLCIPGLITNIIYWLLIFAGIVALFLIIFSGFKFINSGGDSKAVDAAKKTFTYALLGLILIFGSFAIVNLVGKTFGVQNILQFNFGPQDLNSSTQTNNSPTKVNQPNNATCKSTSTKTCLNLGIWGCKCISLPAKQGQDITCKSPEIKTCNANGVCYCDKPVSCSCDDPDGEGIPGAKGDSRYLNHFTCISGDKTLKNSCAQYAYCKGKISGTQSQPPSTNQLCKPITCTCSDSHNFTCTGGFNGNGNNTACSSDQICIGSKTSNNTVSDPPWPCQPID